MGERELDSFLDLLLLDVVASNVLDGRKGRERGERKRLGGLKD